jgi:hypothetical protein
MKIGDLVKHCKNDYRGVVLTVKNNYVEVLLVNPGMYKPEVFHINELEVIKNG